MYINTLPTPSHACLPVWTHGHNILQRVGRMRLAWWATQSCHVDSLFEPSLTCSLVLYNHDIAGSSAPSLGSASGTLDVACDEWFNVEQKAQHRDSKCFYLVRYVIYKTRNGTKAAAGFAALALACILDLDARQTSVSCSYMFIHPQQHACSYTLSNIICQRIPGCQHRQTGNLCHKPYMLQQQLFPSADAEHLHVSCTCSICLDA